MRALVVYCHPSGDSFNASIRDLVRARLQDAGAEIRLHDLYAEGFQPVLTRQEWHDYLDPALTWTGVKDTGRGTSLSYLGFHSVTRPKSYHLKKA